MSSEPAPVPPAPARRAAPGGGARRLNPAQLGVWYAQRMDPGNPVFTMGGYLEIHGPVDPQLLRAAVTALIDEDETARLRFTEADGVPTQYFGPAPQTEPGAPLVELVDLTGEPDPSGEAARRMRQDMDTARDPLRDRLFGHLLFKLGPEHYLWYNREHHLIHDGYTSTLIRRRAAQLYTALATGTEAGPPLGSFARLLDEQAAYPQSAAYRRDGEYWRRIMADAAPPSGPASAGNPSHRVARWVDLVDDTVFAGLRRFAERTNVTWQQAFVAATVVHRYLWTGDSDVVLSLPMPGRLGPTSGAPGMAANMLPLRYRVEPGQTAETLAAEVAAQMLRAQWHQRYPAEELLRDLGWPTRAGRLFGPVVNIVAGDEQSDFAGMPAVHHLLSTGGTAEELSLTVSRTPSGSLRVDYTIDEAFAESADLTAYQRTFARVLAALAERADTAVGELELLDAAERELALYRWNDTAVDIRPLLLAGEDGTEAGDGKRPRSLESLGALVERQARHTPEATALIYEDERLEYAQLNARANRMARRLRASGAGRGAIVGVLLERGLDFAVALLAVAKTGAAYAVLDPDFPDERLHTVIEDAAIGVAVTRARLADRLCGVACLVLADEHAEQINALSGDDLGVEVLALDPACVMFTSGSTGRPKGVLSPHRALIATLTGQHYATFGPGEVFLQCSPVSWDAFSLEFWGALLHGGTCVLQPGQRPEPTHIARLSAQHAVTMLQLSSGLFNVLVDEYPHALTGVRLAFTGGEPASGTHTAKIQHHHPHLTIANGYGPAESMGFTTVFRVPPEWSRTDVPVGSPVTNKRAYLLDARLRPVPVGAVGEVYLGGSGLALGYLDRAALTAERFVADPFGAPGERLYRTGDLARRTSDGALEFVGRADAQVKIRGFRVEPGEIETVLLGHPSVAQAAVTAVADSRGVLRLAAYVIGDAACPDSDRADERALREWLRTVLPDHMVPSAVVALDRMPLTANGKVDRAALPAPRFESAPGSGRGPRDAREEILCALFAEVLGIETEGADPAQVRAVGVDDDFFDLGGHSLAAARLAARAETVFGAQLTLADVFRSPTVAALAELLAARAGTRRVPAPAPVPAQRRPKRLPLSFAQRRLWYLATLEGSNTAYNVPLSVRLEGELDLAALREAFDDLALRHEVLRTVFDAVDGEPCQRLLDRPEGGGYVPFEVVGSSEELVAGQLAEAAVRPFDLAAQPPIRVTVFELGDGLSVLLILLHHIATDGQSLRPLFDDLSTAYAARRDGRAPVWEPLPLQYADYALWQRAALGKRSDPDSVLSRGLDYWTRALEGLPEELPLPLDRPRPAVAGQGGGAVPFAAEPQLRRDIAALARTHRCTPFMVLQAALAVTLTRLGAGTDVALGSPVAGRGHPALDPMVGFFVNTVVLRTDTAGDPAFADLLARVRAADLDAFAHQEAPFDLVLDAVNPVRSLARHPLFQVCLALEGAADAAAGPRLAGAHAGPARFVDTRAAKFDLEFLLREEAGADPNGDSAGSDGPGEDAPGSAGHGAAGLGGAVLFRTDIFEHSTVERLVATYLRVLRQVVADPGLTVSAVDVLGEQERALVVDRWSGAAAHRDQQADEDLGLSLGALFERRAATAADATALVFGTERLTYGELDARANRLARHLIDQGVRRGGIAGVLLERSIEFAVAVLAVAKTGAAYLVLDPEHPGERLRALISQARVSAVVSDSALAQRIADSAHVVCVDESAAAIARYDAAAPGVVVAPEDAACVMFTSGSTGRPKGVLSPHRALIATLTGQHYATFGPGEVFLQCSPVSWDAFSLEFWGALIHGGTCVLQPGQRPEPTHIARLTAQHAVTMLQLSSGLFNVLVDEYPHALTGVRLAFTGGEPASGTHTAKIQHHHPHLTIANGYGPAESMGFTTVFDIPSGWNAGTVPVGSPVAGKRVYVLDDRLRPVPIGVPGEVYLAGDGLAHGYLDRAALTAERFVADPFGPAGGRLYRTGDVARWTPEGVLDFVGRSDGQIKVRGFRVEPGEIEAALLGDPSVAQAAVTAVADDRGVLRLVAYVVSGSGPQLDCGAVRDRLRGLLPDHMVPSAVVALDRMPLTANGKVDRAALPAPTFVAASAGRAPRDAREEVLCSLFAEVLGLASVGIDDGFFELGGHSLAAARLAARARAVFGVELNVRDIFQYPTVTALCERYAPAGGGAATPRPRPVLRRRTEAGVLRDDPATDSPTCSPPTRPAATGESTHEWRTP